MTRSMALDWLRQAAWDELLMDRGDRAATQEAETWLRRAARGGFPYDLIDLGRLLRGRGEYQEAEELFRSAADTGSAAGSIELGFLLNKRGDTEGAERAFRRAAEHGSADAALLLAELLLQRNDDDEGIKWLRAAAIAGGKPGRGQPARDAAGRQGRTHRGTRIP